MRGRQRTRHGVCSKTMEDSVFIRRMSSALAFAAEVLKMRTRPTTGSGRFCLEQLMTRREGTWNLVNGLHKSCFAHVYGFVQPMRLALRYYYVRLIAVADSNSKTLIITVSDIDKTYDTTYDSNNKSIHSFIHSFIRTYIHSKSRVFRKQGQLHAQEGMSDAPHN